MSKDFVNQYAKALFEVGETLEEKTLYLKELRQWEEGFDQDKSVRDFFQSVNISSKDKLEVVCKVCSKLNISSNINHTLSLLVERGKLNYLPKIVKSYEALNDKANGVVRGVVKSSEILSSEQRKTLSEKIESILGKKVILEYQQNPKVIGGVKVQVGSYTFDDTLETHLKKMKDQIINRSVH